MARLGKLIKGTRYQVGRFAGSWYVVNLDQMRFVYGPFIRRATAEARIRRLAHRINPRKRRNTTKLPQLALLRLPVKPAPRVSLNPRRGVRIYGRVLKVFALKTAGPYKGQSFVHEFEPGAVMYGMPDGSIKICHPGK